MLDEPPTWAKSQRRETKYLLVPEELDLVSDFEMVANFVRAIQLTAFRDRRPVHLVFDATREIRPAALLLLLAEIHRCRLVHGPKQVLGTYPTSERRSYAPNDEVFERMSSAGRGLVTKLEANFQKKYGGLFW